MKPVTVYLDTQDYSRLDDARAGRPAGRDLETLQALLTLKARGVARFVYSATIMSELLQYEGAGKELTRRKAETLTLLTDHHTFIYPSQLIAFQVADSLAAQGLIARDYFPPSPISERDRWFPYLGDVFGDFGAQKQAVIDKKVEAAGNRKERRAERAKLQKWRLSETPEHAFQATLRKYPFTPELLTKVLPRLLDGRITRAEAERRWLDEIGDPGRYVVWFFEVMKGDKSSHDWVQTGGEAAMQRVLDLQNKMAVVASEPEALRKFREIAKGFGWQIARGIIARFPEELRRFGVTDTLRQRLAVDDNLLATVPFAKLFGSLLPAYFTEHSGLRETTRRVLRSDGGDIFHTLALPYCDLWRSDRYFADLARQHAPQGSATIVGRLEELPAEIEALAQ